MTPIVLGYWVFERNSDALYAEISQGEGFNRNTIFGVTILPDDHRALSRGGFPTLGLAMDYLASLEERAP